MRSASPSIVSIFLATWAPLTSMAQAPAQDDAASVVPAQPDPVSFPHAVIGDEGTVVVHTPQIDAWPNFESAEAGYLSTTMLIRAHNGPGRIIQ